MADWTSGNYPFAPDKKKPVRIHGDMKKQLVFPEERIPLSALNYVFVSTDKLQVGTWQLAPGGHYNAPEVHAGDEVYYILDGVLTEHNQLLGEFTQVKKGESLLLPMGGYHKAYNFEQSNMRVLYVCAPKIWPDQDSAANFDENKIKMYKGNNYGKLPKYPQLDKWYVHGTTDDIGRWPVEGPSGREEPILFYHITEEKKLINVHGTEYPMLVKFFVSNDLLHMGEFILPAGGTGCRASEPDQHAGDCVLFVEEGPITVFIIDTNETFVVEVEDLMFIPEGVSYRLMNYTDHRAKAIFSIAPGL